MDVKYKLEVGVALDEINSNHWLLVCGVFEQNESQFPI